MKKGLMTLISVLISISAISQNTQYRKDDRPQHVKEDQYNQYQANNVSQTDILRALEIAGVRIFDIPITPVFEREYSLSLNLDEYKDGEKIDSEELLYYPFWRENTYAHYIYDSIEQKDVRYFDYIPKLTIFTKNDNDTTEILNVRHLGLERRGIKLNKKKERDGQFYTWRSYSKTDWILSEEVPMLVFASSWHDGQYERFCGAADLSKDEEATKELLINSPHYFVLSLKVSE